MYICIYIYEFMPWYAACLYVLAYRAARSCMLAGMYEECWLQDYVCVCVYCVCMLLNHVGGTTVCVFGWEVMYLCIYVWIHACMRVCILRCKIMYVRVCVCVCVSRTCIYVGSSCVAAKAYIQVQHRMLIRKKGSCILDARNNSS